ncbi:type IV toxin-antitoxin system AbiEi family antitoxin [Motilibacter deserti]|uniref:AbiEi antitoxin C-terminal domain-containing protein n=1 Tax=Motilibacter deserti TaxID=2714956 RepID=A0ABX0GP38_9ACTN|nr:type IV toxin-antitoxin system AbiEi family antitoxin [Motilibacter deserti]NHC12597.1 hypothetical protein [Motilibacter deserti]
MPRPSQRVDTVALDLLIQRDDGVMSHAELQELGVPLSSVGHKCRPGGPWQRGLPGIVLAHNGRLTRRQQLVAALKYAGPDAVLTGATALETYGARSRAAASVHVLVPQTQHRSSSGFVVVERTWRLPVAVQQARLPLAPVARAVIDEARRTKGLDDVRALVAESVQRLRCDPLDLARELAAGQRRGSALARMALEEVLVGVRSSAEADARSALLAGGVRLPEWNVALYDAHGEFLGVVDGWYDDVAVALEIDSMEFHFTAADYKRTQRRQAKLASAGALVVPVAPGDVRRDRASFARLVGETLERAAGRPRPDIRRAP